MDEEERLSGEIDEIESFLIRKLKVGGKMMIKSGWWTSGEDGVGSLHLKDFIISFQEDSAFFNYTLDANLVELHIRWNIVKPEKVVVDCELPQEALMVQELARIVEGIKKSGCRSDSKQPEISRKTQLAMDAIKQCVDLGCKPVYLTKN
ncbi:hypothetical protein Q3G72_033833 [Acer saccharum]|nr:hypothetical protein Q3G72_033833 [Acer saccharum]